MWLALDPGRLLYGSRLGGLTASASREGLGIGIPVESRLEGRSIPRDIEEERRLLGLSADIWMDDALLPPLRFLLLRTVTFDGMEDCPSAEPLRGDARGGVEVGAGSFERTEWTRCSKLCILLINPWR